jgi:hypothetical protein
MWEYRQDENFALIPNLESEFIYLLNPRFQTFFGRMYLIMQKFRIYKADKELNNNSSKNKNSIK